MALVLEGGYDLVALEGGMRSAVEGMVAGRAVEPARASDDEGVARAVKAARTRGPAWGEAGETGDGSGAAARLPSSCEEARVCLESRARTGMFRPVTRWP